MDNEEKTFTTLEAEFLAGFVYGCALEAMGVTGKANLLSKEQEQLMWQFIASGMALLGKKSSIQVQAEEELERLLEGKDE